MALIQYSKQKAYVQFGSAKSTSLVISCYLLAASGDSAMARTAQTYHRDIRQLRQLRYGKHERFELLNNAPSLNLSQSSD